jgi:hypothetical protein
MTASERQFLSGDGLDPAYSFEDSVVRQIGCLSEPQNVGGLF